MKRLFLIFLFLIICIACDSKQQNKYDSIDETSHIRDNYGNLYLKHCIEGITYISNGHRLTVKMDKQGRIETCN